MTMMVVIMIVETATSYACKQLKPCVVVVEW